MGYYEMLTLMIKNSGLTLQEIADKCSRDSGVDITKSYISKLQTKKQAPASDEVNEAIAKACNGNVEELLYEAYIEKAPEFIKRYIKTLIQITKEMGITALRHYVSLDSALSTESRLSSLSDIEFISVIERFKDNYLDFLIDNSGENSTVLKQPSDSLKKVTMWDDSMEPLILKDSIVYYDPHSPIKDGDIVYIKSNNFKLVGRVYPQESDEKFYPEDEDCIVTFDNPQYSPILFHSMHLLNMSKVVSVTTTRKF